MISLSLPDGPLSVLALGAHPDDVEIGCGATLLMLGERGGLVSDTMILTGSRQRRIEAEEAASRFLPGGRVRFAGLPDGRVPARWDLAKDALEDLAREVQPDLIFAPRADDAHQDHRLLGALVTTVWRDCLVLHYDIPKWDGDLHPVTHYVRVPDHVAALKIKNLNTCFPSQLSHDWWDEEMFRGLMRLRGMECRSRYAEGFSVSKAAMEICPGGSA